MEINFNTNIDSVNRTNGFTPRGREVRPVNAQVSFENANALNQALDNIPDVRSEEVKRAQDLLLGSVPYPPAATVAEIAHLLALNLEHNQ